MDVIEIKSSNGTQVQIIDQKPSNINLTQSLNSVIEIVTQGPQGPQGPAGRGFNPGDDITTTGYVSASVYYGDGSNLTGITTDTGSFVVTASAGPNGSDTIIFGKGDGTTFNVIVPSPPLPAPTPAISTSSFFTNATLTGGTLSFTQGDSNVIRLTLPSDFPYTGSAEISGSLSIDGFVSASTYYGDGSNLEGVEGFPYTGSAEITGSLEVTGNTTVNGDLLIDGYYKSTNNTNTEHIFYSAAQVGTNKLVIWKGQSGWQSNLIHYLGSGGANQRFGIEVGNTEALSITNTGKNVGIGTISPQERLHVVGNAIITGSNSLAGSYALRAVNSSGINVLSVENDNKIYLRNPSHTSGDINSTGSIVHYGDLTLGPVTSNAPNRKLTIAGYDKAQVEFNLHGGWGKPTINANFDGTIKYVNYGVSSTNLNFQFGESVSRQGSMRFYTNSDEAIKFGTNGGYPLAYIGVVEQPNNYNGGLVIKSRNGTSIVNTWTFGRYGDLTTPGNINLSGSLIVSQSVTASTYYGDGSNLTGINTGSWDGIFTGSAVISGSLEVVGDITGSGKISLNYLNGTHVVIGNEAGSVLGGGDGSTFVGYQAGKSSTGPSAGQTLIGYRAGNGLTSGAPGAVMVGYNAGGVTNGSWMVGIGNSAYVRSTGGVAIGSSTRAGFYDVSLGYQTGVNSSTSYTISIGRSTGTNAQGNYHILIGEQSGYYIKGTSNISIGNNAGVNISGSNNIALGFRAGYSTSGSNNVLLGYQAGYNLTGSNQLIIANNSSSALITGDFENNTLNISGSTTIIGSLTVEGSGSTIFEVNGSEGQLFSITDSLSGSLFAVSDVSGLPILEVFSDDRIVAGAFNNKALVISGSHTTLKNTVISGSLNVSSSVTASTYYGDGSNLTGINTGSWNGIFTGSAVITGSTTISGSLKGSVIDITPTNQTASLNCSLSNFFTLTLSSSANTFLTASNIQPGQTINLRITQPATSGSLSYGSEFKFPNGLPYSVSATGSVVDILSFIAFDSNTLYGSSLKNFI
jgi:hypothetical protein